MAIFPEIGVKGRFLHSFSQINNPIRGIKRGESMKGVLVMRYFGL